MVKLFFLCNQNSSSFKNLGRFIVCEIFILKKMTSK